MYIILQVKINNNTNIIINLDITFINKPILFYNNIKIN